MCGFLSGIRFGTLVRQIHLQGPFHVAIPGSVVAAPTSFAQTNVPVIAQVISSATPVKITGASTFIEQGTQFDNDGANDLTIRYIIATAQFVKFEWSVRVREDPSGAGMDGTVNVFLAVGGATIAATQVTSPVNVSHGGTAAGIFIRNTALNEVFELFASRDSGGGNGAILSVVFTATVL